MDLALRARFNPALDKAWFGSVMQIINHITMLSIILTGAALIREREHGTIEHLLVMPVTPTEIMLSKVWSMGPGGADRLGSLSLNLVVRGVLGVPIEGSIALFFAGAALHLFATTSMGIFLATLARNMPQFGMLMMLTIMPLQMLSGGTTPRESMPEIVQNIMLIAPTTHFVELSQAILYRGAGLDGLAALSGAGLIGSGAVFPVGLALRFRKTIGQMA
ncbi:MAG: ABC transporter permease [Chiayiivirga sp.]|nr:ABC transporter permease [Chiayiivirga sp.]